MKAGVFSNKAGSFANRASSGVAFEERGQAALPDL